MSTQEPLWYCHECQDETRPIMVPDPVCASCHGSFVEKMENPADDPRNFLRENPGLESDFPDIPPDVDTLFMGLQSLMERGMEPNTSRSQRPRNSSSTFELRDRNGSRTYRFGGDNTLGLHDEDQNDRRPPPGVPDMSTFIRSGPQTDTGRPTINGALLAQYLMGLLGNQGPGVMFGVPENGRLGDYVFNQEALDRIITQIMENSNGNRPVPASEEIVNNLPRDVLTEGSAMLQKDCAVCKDQFKLETEDPDELVIVTLPCTHPFHEPCILPWLQSSGTCPVCRHALVPQPEHPPAPSRSNSGPDTGSNSRHNSGPDVRSGSRHNSGPDAGSGGRRNSGPDAGSSGRRNSGPSNQPGFFQSVFGSLAGHENHSLNSGGRPGSYTDSPRPSSRRPPTPHTHTRRGSGPSSSRRNTGRDNLPGSWSEDLD